MMHHFVVAVGFFVGPNFVSLYIPDTRGDPDAAEHQRQQVCHVKERETRAVNLNRITGLGTHVS